MKHMLPISNSITTLYQELQLNQKLFGFEQFQYHLAEQGEVNLVAHLTRILDRQKHVIVNTEYSFDPNHRADLLLKDTVTNTFYLIEAKFYPSVPDEPKKKRWNEDDIHYRKLKPQLKCYYDRLKQSLGNQDSNIVVGFICFEVAYFLENDPLLRLWSKDHEKNQPINGDFYDFAAFERNQNFLAQGGKWSNSPIVGLAVYGRFSEHPEEFLQGVDCEKDLDKPKTEAGAKGK